MSMLDESVVVTILYRHPEEAPFLHEAWDQVTFRDLWTALDDHQDPYDVLGISDSCDREYAFEYLVEALVKEGFDVDYDDVYLTWLGHQESVVMMCAPCFMSHQHLVILKDCLNDVFRTPQGRCRVSVEVSGKDGHCSFLVNWSACGDQDLKATADFIAEVRGASRVAEFFNDENLFIEDDAPRLSDMEYDLVVDVFKRQIADALCGRASHFE